MEFDRKMQNIDGIAMLRYEVLVLVRLDKGRKNLETIAVGGAGLGFEFEITGYFADRPVVIPFIVERLYVHHHTVSASMRSYSLCVPTNLMRAVLNL